MSTNAPSSRLQSFSEKSDPARGVERLARLRDKLQELGLNGFLVPRADEHQGEYVPASEQRLAWLTGFSGSAGTAVALLRKAAFFSDGRYTEQARQQVDGGAYKLLSINDTTPQAWVAAMLGKGRLGYDPRLHTPGEIASYERAAAEAGGTLVAVEQNPIDLLWADRPRPPLAQVSLHPIEFAGEAAPDKLVRLRNELKAERCDALLVTDPHAVAWLFNIRGADVPHTPLALGYALVPVAGRPTLFLDGRKLSNTVRSALVELAEVAEPASLDDTLRKASSQARVRLDAATASVRFKALIEAAGGRADVGRDPLALMKAQKNRVEIAGSRAAHVRDDAAMVEFLAWFDREAPKGSLTEISAAIQLDAFRVGTGKLKDLSFPSISAAGPNAALPHYRVSETSNRAIGPGIYLIDSGGQYEDGTTDITRTISVGEPTRLMRDRFTRVLKGMIAISRLVFPKGTSGAQLDAFARQSLWQAGLDFDHGTGHGIGSYLSVHEGPQRLSKVGTQPLMPGMILSNEPGYYKVGAFGIRIENLLAVEPRKIRGAEREMYGFETLSFAPIDRRLIARNLLTREERRWLDDYHTQVRRLIGPHVATATMAWLEAATAPI